MQITKITKIVQNWVIPVGSVRFGSLGVERGNNLPATKSSEEKAKSQHQLHDATVGFLHLNWQRSLVIYPKFRMSFIIIHYIQYTLSIFPTVRYVHDLLQKAMTLHLIIYRWLFISMQRTRLILGRMGVAALLHMIFYSPILLLGMCRIPRFILWYLTYGYNQAKNVTDPLSSNQILVNNHKKEVGNAG